MFNNNTKTIIIKSAVRRDKNTQKNKTTSHAIRTKYTDRSDTDKAAAGRHNYRVQNITA